MISPILVAVDGSRSGFGALRVAYALAERDDRPLHVVAVHAPFDLPGMGGRYPLSGAGRDFERQFSEDLEDAIREQLDRLGAYEPRCRLTVLTGTAAPAVARHAAAIGAEQIVIGFSRTTALERLGASEMPVRIMQLANVPVLAVPKEADALPRRAVVAVDFSDFSLAAVRAAGRLVGRSGEMHLVHVLAEQPLAYGWWPVDGEWLDDYWEAFKQRLEQLAVELREQSGAAVRGVMLDGEPAHAIQEYARRVGADLIAAGTHGYGYFARLVLGSVSTRLLRSAEGAVLLVPPAAAVEEAVTLHGVSGIGARQPSPKDTMSSSAAARPARFAPIVEAEGP